MKLVCSSLDTYVGVTKTHGIENEIIASKGLTPPYKAAGIKDGVFSGPEFVYTKGYYAK